GVWGDRRLRAPRGGGQGAHARSARDRAAPVGIGPPALDVQLRGAELPADRRGGTYGGGHSRIANPKKPCMATDFDSPWKEALDCYFEAFLALLFPNVHQQIDWTRGHESLDKEFQQVVREAEVGRRYVDKLAKVWTKDGV